jgi:toxin CcdB
MARFDVYRLAGEGLVVDCQANLLSHLKTRLVVPLLPTSEVVAPMKRLNPTVLVGECEYLFCPDLAATVLANTFSEPVGSLEHESDSLGAALDMLLIGF